MITNNNITIKKYIYNIFKLLLNPDDNTLYISLALKYSQIFHKESPNRKAHICFMCGPWKNDFRR